MSKKMNHEDNNEIVFWPVRLEILYKSNKCSSEINSYFTIIITLNIAWFAAKLVGLLVRTEFTEPLNWSTLVIRRLKRFRIKE